VKREYTHALIRDFAGGCAVHLVGSPRLAELSEAVLHGQPVDDGDIAAELAPCFVERDGACTDTVVLACTHFPLVLERLERLAPWPVTFVDPAPAIARRVVELLGGPAGPAGPATHFIFMSGRPTSAVLKTALAGFGIGEIATANA
jgi:glutamate racemase